MRFLLLVLMFAFYGCKDKDVVQEDPEVIIDPGQAGYLQYGTPLDSVPQGRDIQMYEVNLRAFSNSGDLEGVTSQLDRLDSLGINVIWLMPIHPIGSVNSVNSPYSVKNYLEVSEEYGDLDALRTLTDAAHSRGIGQMWLI